MHIEELKAAKIIIDEMFDVQESFIVPDDNKIVATLHGSFERVSISVVVEK